MNAIVVADRSWAIGRDGGLLFSLPTDMKRFRSLTMGGAVILGRKTLESFPGGRPLPKRKNIVITRRKDLQVEGAVVVSSLAEALDAAGDTPPDQIWVIGGGSVYTALLERCKRVYLTKVDAQAEDPDTFFPNLDKLPGWEVEHESEPVEENGLTFRFVEYINQKI
ncbi:MAG: dihydrofolate reductase [Dysosmobacter sp.]|jgi:dihydrofolate reductase|uniref:dihydrofolate reductase n=1 Tax=Dysosmobacter sp. TaxID=2591382 RepID=UPI003D8E9EF1